MTDLRTKDLANAAAILEQATRRVEEADRTVSTPYGRATVIRDGEGVDVVLHDRDVTVHVRPESRR
jgi:hypothetical protein